MKRLLFLLLAVSILTTGCTKKDEQKEAEKKEDVVLEKKYAKYRVSIKKDKDLKDWKYTLQKAEPVDLLALEEVTIKDKKKEIAKVRLTDGENVGYIESRHLADKPIVITEDTKAYYQNNNLSKVKTTIPKGTIVFITQEKSEWTKIYAGRVGNENVYVDDKWIQKNSYSEDQNLIRAARDLEKALDILKTTKSKNKAEEAKKLLTELSEEANMIGTLAKEKLTELENMPAEETEEKPKEDKSEDTVDGTTEVEG